MTKNDTITAISNNESTLVADVLAIIRKGRESAYNTINISMLETYWRIGQRIVEEEQHGEQRAEYGTRLIKILSQELSERLGKGFSTRNLAYYRLFLFDLQ